MTEPTQDALAAASDYWMNTPIPLMPSDHFTPYYMSAYANHRTAKLQAKIDRLEAADAANSKYIVALLDERTDKEVKFTIWEDGMKARIATLEAELAARDFVPITEADWHEDIGPVLWWKFPIEEPPYSGSPLDTDWPGYHTHFTRIPLPQPPAKEGE